MADNMTSTPLQGYVNSASIYNDELENINMTHYIADEAIRDAVSRLTTKIRSQNPETPIITFVLETLSESPEGNDKRKNLEARIKAKMGLRILHADRQDFAEKEAFEKEAGELALEFAIEDAKKMVDENLKMLARK
ncbi:hypothetical protein KCU95_g16489, partial [Aureobasidium melanogenum]